MPEFFTQQWVEAFANKWNADEEMVGPLSTAAFDAIIAFGYSTQEAPSVLLEVKKGKVARAGLFNSATNPGADWDLRASREQWKKWKQQPLGLIGLGVAVSSGQLQFKSGDYRKMIRNPKLASPFLRCFTLL